MPLTFWELVKSNITQEWNWEKLSANPNITWKNVVEEPGCPWNMRGLSCNPNITWKIICDNPHLKWDMNYVAKNPNITLDIIEANMDLFIDALSENPNITWEFIKKHPSKTNHSWKFSRISLNPNITWDNVMECPNADWEWDHLSKHPNITLDIIYNNPMRKWNWSYVAVNPNITFNDIIADPRLYNIFQTPTNHNLTLPEIMTLTSTNRPVWTSLSSNPNITLNEVVNYQNQLTWWIMCSDNPNFTPKFVQEMISRKATFMISFTTLSANPMGRSAYFTSPCCKKKLVRKLLCAEVGGVCFKDELMAAAMHPRWHPGNWMSQDELIDHPFSALTQKEITAMYRSLKACVLEVS